MSGREPAAEVADGVMSSVPGKMSSSPSTEARAQKALIGFANAQIAPTANRTPRSLLKKLAG